MDESTTTSRALLCSVHQSGDPRVIATYAQRSGRGSRAAKADVVELKMTDAQCRDPEGRTQAVESALSTMAVGGIIWVNVPGRWRTTFARTLRTNAMMIGNYTVEFKVADASTEFTLSPECIRFAIERGLISRHWRWIWMILLLAPFARSALIRFLPGLGYAAYSKGTLPFGWLARRMPDRENCSFVVTASRQSESSPFVVLARSKGVSLVAKRFVKGAPSIEREAAALTGIAAAAAAAGINVPQLIERETSGQLSSLIETAVPGRPMAGRLVGGHHRDLSPIAERLATWLGKWHRSTAHEVELTSQLAETLILAPASRAKSAIEGAGAYFDWLEKEARELIGHKVPLVAAHNDLTMFNVLADASGIRSVVDWEDATAQGLPLTDFHYSVCDAAKALGGDRLAAFRFCFLDDGAIRRHLGALDEQLRKIVGGPPRWLDLCFHAGWLGHVANEQGRPDRSSNNGFKAIAELLSVNWTELRTRGARL